MKKKILSAVLSAFMAVSMMVVPAMAEAESPSDALEDVAEPVTLSLMVTTRPATDNKDFFVDILPELVHERFPNITIEVEQLPTDQYKQTVRLKFASGEGPDLFTWWAQKQAEDLVEGGYVRDLSDFEYLDKFKASIVDTYSFDGAAYGLPLGTSFLTTWYNKDMFAEAGIETYPMTWDEFVDDCAKLKEAGFTPIVTGDNSSFVIQYAMYQMGASEIYGENFDFDSQLYTGETKFTDQCWVDTVTKLAYLYENGYVMEDTLGISQEQSRQLFIDGEAAMTFDGSFSYAQLMNEGAVQFERGVFCTPTNAEGEEFVYNWTPANALFTSNISDELHQEACDRVMSYWFDETSPLFKEWVANTTDIICFEGVADTREMINEYLDRYSEYKNIYNLNNAWPEGVSDEMCSVFQEVITGDATPEDVCQAMQDKFDELTE